MDHAYAAGKDIRPLCGLAFAVKDNIDVVGYATEAGTPALAGVAHTNKGFSLSGLHTHRYPGYAVSRQKFMRSYVSHNCLYSLLPCFGSVPSLSLASHVGSWRYTAQLSADTVAPRPRH